MESLLDVANQLNESEKYYLEALPEVRATPTTRRKCLQGLGRISIQRREWSKSVQYLEEGLALLLEEPEPHCGPHANLRFQLEFLGFLGNVLEGQGEWARARQHDKQALDISSQPPLDNSYSEIMGALRREAIEFIREGRPELAITSNLQKATYYYTTNLELYGINPLQDSVLQPLMAALKVWVEGCFLAANVDCVARATDILADMEETEALIGAYHEAALEETRREAKIGRAHI